MKMTSNTKEESGKKKKKLISDQREKVYQSRQEAKVKTGSLEVTGELYETCVVLSVTVVEILLPAAVY